MSTVHPVAKVGFGTGTNELYDRSRPSYPSSALSHIRQAVTSTPPYNIVEIGSGTGIFTRALLSHPEWKSSVKQLVAVEPSSGMRQQFEKGVQDERVSVIEGTFEATGIEDGWADIITIAQAFHWCSDFERAAAEFARILRPGGIVALVWNTDDRSAAPWLDQVRDRILRHTKDHPGAIFDREPSRHIVENAFKQFFEPSVESTFPHIIPVTEQLVVDRMASKSHIVILPEEERAKTLQDIRDIVSRGEGLTWMDKANGVFEYPYQTLVLVFKRK